MLISGLKHVKPLFTVQNLKTICCEAATLHSFLSVVNTCIVTFTRYHINHNHVQEESLFMYALTIQAVLNLVVFKTILSIMSNFLSKPKFHSISSPARPPLLAQQAKREISSAVQITVLL